MRSVADPHGVAWNVDVSWTDIRFGTQFKGRRERRARKRRDRAEEGAQRREEGNRGWWLDALDVPGDFGELVAVIVVVAVIVIAVLTFPWLLVLFLDLAEILVFPLLALGIIGWRVMRRRPFTITAERKGEPVAEWRVVGARDARRVERSVADAIVAGGDAVELFPEYASHH